MKTKPKAFGRDWTDGELKFPEHLTPKTIHSALFIYNADSTEETKQRVEYCAKEIGDKAMSFAMEMLMLPTLMNSMAQSEEYTIWNEQRHKKLN